MLSRELIQFLCLESTSRALPHLQKIWDSEGTVLHKKCSRKNDRLPTRLSLWEDGFWSWPGKLEREGFWEGLSGKTDFFGGEQVGLFTLQPWPHCFLSHYKYNIAPFPRWFHAVQQQFQSGSAQDDLQPRAMTSSSQAAQGQHRLQSTRRCVLPRLSTRKV